MTVRELFVTLGFQVDQGSLSKTESIINNLKSLAGKALGAIGIGLSAVALKRFTSECINLASTAEQIQNKFDVVFKGMDKEANKWAEDYANTVGRSVTTIKGYMADAQNLLVGFMGEDRRREAMQMSEDMTSLALDIASFSNMNEDEAVARMTKAVMGEAEAAKSLGAVLNEVTRAEAMERLQIQGKYDDLDMATRMQVNYNAILSQSADAVGDCVRSMDSYESRQRQLNSSVRYFKEYLGSQLLPTAARVLKLGNDIVKKGTEWAKKLVALNSKLKISKTLGEGFDRIFRGLGSVFSWAGSLVDIFVNSVGGAENALRILAVVAGGLLAVFQPLIAIIALVTIVIEDFVTFMEGGVSVTGGIFEQFGISASDARLKIQGAFNAIKKAVEGTVKFIGQLASGDFAGAMATLKSGWTTAWGSISKAGSSAVDKIKGFITNTKWTEVGQNAGKKVSDGIKAGIDFLKGIGNKVKGFINEVNWSQLGTNASSKFKSAMEIGVGLLSGIGDTIKGFFTAVDWNQIGSDLIALVKGGIDTGAELISGINEKIQGFFAETDWTQVGTNLGNSVRSGISTAISGASHVIANLKTFFTSTDWKSVGNTIGSTVKSGIDTGVALISAVGETIKGFFTGVDWSTVGSDLIGLVQSGIELALDKVKGVIEGIKGIFEGLEITMPEPLQQFFDWTSGIIEQIVNGLESDPDALKNAIVELWSGVVTWFEELPATLIQWGKDIVSNIVEGILSAPKSIADALHEAIFGGSEEERAEAADYYGSLGATGVSESPIDFAEVKTGKNAPSVDEQIAQWVGDGRISAEAGQKLADGVQQAWDDHEADWQADGIDMQQLLAAGIESGKYLTDEAAQQVANGISELLGFSVPSKGPLSDADSYMPDFMNLLSEGITSNSEAVVSAVETMAQGMSDALKQAFQDMASAAQTGMSQVQSSVQTGMSAVLATMQSLASQAYTSGLHFVENLVNGINAGLPALRAAASEVASIMSEQVKHSVPKKGPMKDDDQWMRHYMQNLANGIKQNKGLVTDQMSTLAQDLAALGQPASGRTAASAGGFSRRMMSVNQNVTISNSYNGTAGGADKAIRNTMKKSAYDASTYMAKAIGYARG